MGNSVYEGNQRDELERTLRVRSAGGFGDSQPCSAMSLPYPMNGYMAVELGFKVFAACSATSNSRTVRY